MSLDKINYLKNNIFSYGNNSTKLYSITRKLLSNELHLNYSRFSNDILCSLFIENCDYKVINICNKINNIVLNEDISILQYPFLQPFLHLISLSLFQSVIYI